MGGGSRKVLSSKIHSVNFSWSRERSDAAGTTGGLQNGCNICGLLFRISEYWILLLHQFKLNSHPQSVFYRLFVALKIVPSLWEDAHLKVFFRWGKGKMFFYRGILVWRQQSRVLRVVELPGVGLVGVQGSPCSRVGGTADVLSPLHTQFAMSQIKDRAVNAVLLFLDYSTVLLSNILRVHFSLKWHF